MKTFYEIHDREELLRDIERLLDRKLAELQKPSYDPPYTRKQAAEYLGRSAAWLDQMIRGGKIKRSKVGGSVFIKKSELDKAMQ